MILCLMLHQPHLSLLSSNAALVLLAPFDLFQHGSSDLIYVVSKMWFVWLVSKNVTQSVLHSYVKDLLNTSAVSQIFFCFLAAYVKNSHASTDHAYSSSSHFPLGGTYMKLFFKFLFFTQGLTFVNTTQCLTFLAYLILPSMAWWELLKLAAGEQVTPLLLLYGSVLKLKQKGCIQRFIYLLHFTTQAWV